MTNDTSHFFHLAQVTASFGMIYACIIAEAKRGLHVGNVELNVFIIPPDLFENEILTLRLQRTLV